MMKMRNIYKSIFGTLLSLPLLFSGCSDDYQNSNLGDQPLVLSVSNKTIALDITEPNSEAVTFEWSSGSNHNTNSAISYLFEFDQLGNDFANSIKVELSQGTRSVKYRTAEFNTILIEELGVEPSTEVELEARVTATVHNDKVEAQISEVVALSVVGYKPLSETLYLVGSAAPNGDDVDNATAMNTVASSAGSFVWQGALNKGELRFITTLGKELPAYFMGEEEEVLYLRESESDTNGVPFEIAATGSYKISLNIIDLSIDIEAVDAPTYSQLWFVGGFTGWSFEEMRVSKEDPFVFYYNAELNSGGGADDFKIATQPDFDGSIVFLRPEVNGEGAGEGLKVVAWSENEKPGGENDHKWHLDDGVYKIKLDTRAMTIDIVPFTPFEMVYLVGEATPNGWSIDNATPLIATDSPYKFTWEGTLKEGEMKFTCDKQSDWNGAWFLASVDGIEPSGELEQMIFSAVGSNPDNKWSINKEGTYTIELDQLQESVIIKKK